MKDATTGKTLEHRKKSKAGTDWKALRDMSDEDIRAGIEADPDAHATDGAFWDRAEVVMPEPKKVVTMRLDADLLEWFRQENGYQTRINAILRAYYEAHKGNSSTRP